LEFKGTKGELELIKIDFADYFQVSICSKEENKVVAQIFGYDKQEAKANALLFSKAPKLLAMLNSCKLAFEQIGMQTPIGLTELIKEATEI